MALYTREDMLCTRASGTRKGQIVHKIKKGRTQKI